MPEMECFATALHFFKTNFDEDFYTMSSEEDKDTLKQLSEVLHFNVIFMLSRNFNVYLKT